jgi:drug/metabolite transporter (DMT)-like permease
MNGISAIDRMPTSVPAIEPLLVPCPDESYFAGTSGATTATATSTTAATARATAAVTGFELMAILLALGAAVGWGATDYYGGAATRRDTSVFVIVALSELLGVVLLLPALLAHGVAPPMNPRLLFAVLAGLATTAELSLIYRALSRGNAFITAPVGALGAAVAVTIGLLGGDPLDLAIAAGLLCAVLGGGISAWTSPAGSETGTVQNAGICLGAATAVGAMLICFHAAARVDPYWATATEHLSTALSAGVAALIAGRRSPRHGLPQRPQLRTLALIATVGVGGDLAYAGASHTGALSVVSAISSLYPLTTIVLGRIVQGQRPTPTQLGGIAIAILGAVLLGASTQ